MKYLSTVTLALVLSACGGTDDPTVIPETNTAPVADAGVDQNVTVENSITLDASNSSDSDGDTLSYDWAAITIPEGSSAALDTTTTAMPTFTADVAGEYTFQVAVSDDSETVTDEVTITASEISISGSTAGVECDYSYDEFNSSESVQLNSTSAWTCSETTRDLAANGVPDHEVGTFPNENNPITMTEQETSASLTLTPVETDIATELGGPAGVTGYVLNGVKIDPGTAGTCDDSGENCSLIGGTGTWSIEALGQESFDFGDDFNNAHVQPGGAYHYHGMPEGFIDLQGNADSSMTHVGWAADGFPIYARYGYSDAIDSSSSIINIEGSYQLITDVSAARPSVDVYALGTFSSDWEYIEGSGDLDECNGRFGVTPEFPDGIYHYYATDSYPYLQRCVKGEVTGAGGPGGGGGPGGEGAPDDGEGDITPVDIAPVQ